MMSNIPSISNNQTYQPNLSFLKLFVRNKIDWPFDHLAIFWFLNSLFGNIWIKTCNISWILTLNLQSVSRIWASLWWFDFRLEPIYTNALAASKNGTCFKSGQNWLENNHLAFVSLNQWHTEETPWLIFKLPNHPFQ